MTTEEPTLAEILVLLKRIDARTAVNNELIQVNLNLNQQCQETSIVPLPPLKLETKIKIAARVLSDSTYLLVGKTFDIRQAMKDSVPLAFTSTPEKGWVCSKENLPKLQKDLIDIAEIIVPTAEAAEAVEAAKAAEAAKPVAPGDVPSVHSIFTLS